MLSGFRPKSAHLLSRASYYTLQSIGLNLEREARTQQLIFPGFDHMVIPNIYTLKPKPGQEAVDMHDYDWYSQQLKQHGHIILKNTGIKEPTDFKKWEPLFLKDILKYDGGQSDRDDIGGGVLNVNTFEPSVMDILSHNEMSYHNYFPQRIAFCCFTQAQVGGITTLVDNRKVSKYMPQKLLDKLINLGQNVETIYQNKEAIGEEEKWYSNWQDQYRVKDKESLVQILEKENIDYEFFRNDWLRTSVTTPAIHYDEGEMYLIHSIDSSHESYFQFLDQFNKLTGNERPFSVMWGNKEELTKEEFFLLAQINSKYEILVNYEVGDIFLMDNIKFKHGRTPFIGPRKVGALMGNKVRRQTSP